MSKETQDVCKEEFEAWAEKNGFYTTPADDRDYYSDMTQARWLVWQEAVSTCNRKILQLHRELAGEKLRADQGWQRAEAKSKECIELRERMAR